MLALVLVLMLPPVFVQVLALVLVLLLDFGRYANVGTDIATCACWLENFIYTESPELTAVVLCFPCSLLDVLSFGSCPSLLSPCVNAMHAIPVPLSTQWGESEIRAPPLKSDQPIRRRRLSVKGPAASVYPLPP